MKADQLIQYLNFPENLNILSLSKLEEWIEKYPYFQTARLLRVKNIKNVRDSVDKGVLNRTAAYVTDRKVLYYLLHQLKNSPVIEEKDDDVVEEGLIHEKEYKESLEENISETINNQLHEYEFESQDEIELIPGLAIDIRKEYGAEEAKQVDFDLDVNNRLEDLLELTDERLIQGEITKEVESKAHSLEENTTLDLEDGSLFNESDLLDISHEEDQGSISINSTPDLQTLETEITRNEEATEPQEEVHKGDSVSDHFSFIDWLDQVADTKSPGSKDDQKDVEKEQKKAKSNTNEGVQELRQEVPYNLNQLSKKVETDKQEGDESGEQNKKNVLIDNFIEKNPKISPTESSRSNEDISLDSVKEHDSFFTDTLARIYVKQGNYAKAILAYERLSLKYPEKSTYFAGQISEIKKLIRKI